MKNNFANATLVCFFACMIAITGCRKAPVRVARPAAKSNAKQNSIPLGHVETGLASWYGVPYHGRQSASGEIFDMEKFTAAHKTLPFQTWVQVTNLDNGSVVEVRINDRGPFVPGRIVDLSKAAGREIGLLQSGLAHVRLKVIEPPNATQRQARQPTQATQPTQPTVTAAAPSSYTVQAGLFDERTRAEALAQRMVVGYGDARVVRGPYSRNTQWRVVVGRHLTLGQAGQIFARLRSEIADASIISEPEDANLPE